MQAAYTTDSPSLHQGQHTEGWVGLHRSEDSPLNTSERYVTTQDLKWDKPDEFLGP